MLRTIFPSTVTGRARVSRGETAGFSHFPEAQPMEGHEKTGRTPDLRRRVALGDFEGRRDRTRERWVLPARDLWRASARKGFFELWRCVTPDNPSDALTADYGLNATAAGTGVRVGIP